MNDTITYRTADQSDYSAILQLYNKAYNTNRSIEDFVWLNEKNPAGKAVLFIALLDEKVIGMQSLIPYMFRCGSQITLTYKSEDSLVHKDFRGKGIYSKLYKMVHEYAGQTLVWGLTDKKEILERVGMPSIDQLTTAVSINRPVIPKEKIGFHRIISKWLYYNLLYMSTFFKVKNRPSTIEVESFPYSEFGREGIQSFFQTLYDQYPTTCFPDMNEEYLNWRFVQNPNFEAYRIFVSKNSTNHITALSILAIEGTIGYYESIYFTQDVPMSDRVSHVVQCLDFIFAEKVGMIHTWLFQCNPLVKEASNVFVNAGFKKVKKGLWIIHNEKTHEIATTNLYFSPQLGIR